MGLGDPAGSTAAYRRRDEWGGVGTPARNVSPYALRVQALPRPGSGLRASTQAHRLSLHPLQHSDYQEAVQNQEFTPSNPAGDWQHGTRQ